MALRTLKTLGQALPKPVADVLGELQRLNVAVLTGATANTKINVAAIRPEDTVVSAIMFTTGVPSDITNTITIVDPRATGTVTCASAAAADTVTIHGKVYTFKTAGTANPLNNEVNLGANDTGTAANLVAQVNRVDPAVVLTNALGVVTITAFADGTGPNAYTLASSNGTRLAVSGSGTLAGGTATGGVKSSSNTSSNTVLLYWFDKNA